MCGRTCLTLEPGEITKACRYKCNCGNNSLKENKPDNDSKSLAQGKKEEEVWLEPEYRLECNSGLKYMPSYNIAPTDITPVLVSVDHFFDEEDTKDIKNRRIIVPMMWGMIPFWHKGDYRKHGLTTNNCRLEHMLESKMYRGPFKRGQRCVILCEGFYEWYTRMYEKPSKRAVYFLHMPQKEKIKIYDRSTWQAEDINLLKMAGLFDVWKDENGDKIFSYSVITFKSSQAMYWPHDRMPAILETEEQVNNWLDFKNVSDEQALATLRPAKGLQSYQVSNIVNNSRNKSNQCNKPIEIVKKEKPAMNKMMSAWLNVRKRKEASVAQIGSDSSSSTGGNTSDCELDTLDTLAKLKRPRFRDFKRALRSSQNLDPEIQTSDANNSNWENAKKMKKE